MDVCHEGVKDKQQKADVCRCSANQLFLKVLRNLQESNCAGTTF